MNYEAIVVGTSAGGLEALQRLLSPLPADFALPVMVVQHRLPTLNDFLTQTLNQACALTVKEADEKEPITPGMVYLAPANYHLLVERDKTFSISIDAKVNYSRPSIDVLFETASDAYVSKLIGIILTGANRDGTLGLKKIKTRGGLTMAQNPSTAEVEMMPRSAIEASVIDKILTLEGMSLFLTRLSNLSMVKQKPSEGDLSDFTSD